MVLPTDNELRSLRARAYGPAADIELDPSAAQRLRELEAIVGRRVARAHGVAGDATAVPHATPAEPGEAIIVAAAEGAAAQSTGNGATPRPRLSRRTKTLWAASVVASAALAAGVAAAVLGIAPVSASGDAAPTATLDLNTAPSIPVGWFGAYADTRATEFHGVTLFTSIRGALDLAQGDAIAECLLAVPSELVPESETFNESSWTFESPFHYAGCSVGGFPATVEVPLGNYAPAELREQFPGAKALQFVLEGDQIRVILDGR